MLEIEARQNAQEDFVWSADYLNDPANFYDVITVMDLRIKCFVQLPIEAQKASGIMECSTISYTANNKKKVRFLYTSYGLNGKKRYTSECPNGSHLVETPIALIFSNDNYYLETWNESCAETHTLMRRRLDRMEDVTVSDENADYNDEIKQAKKRENVATRTRMSVDMLGSGEPCHLFLRVDEMVAANIILNKFGYDCILEERRVPRDEDGSTDIGASGVAFITVQLSPTFYRLLCGLGEMVQIIKPKFIWSNQSKWTKGKRADIPYDQLMAEYEQAVAGYTEHLRSSLAMYE